MDIQSKLDIATVCIAFLALIIAFVSWRTSHKTLKLGIESYEFQNRPWLLIDIKKDEKSQRYFNIVREGNSIFWVVQILIENKGLSPAKDIKLPSIGNLKDIVGTNKIAPINLDKIVLGQGQKYIYTLSFGGDFKGNVEEIFNKYKENDKELNLSFFLTYKGMINPKKEYKTNMNYQINSNLVSTLENSDFQ
jgi:hypothetical protein